jgi:hypothetical protein
MQLVEGEGKNKIGRGQKKKLKIKGGEGKARWTLNPIGQYARTGLGIAHKSCIDRSNSKVMII